MNGPTLYSAAYLYSERLQPAVPLRYAPEVDPAADGVDLPPLGVAERAERRTHRFVLPRRVVGDSERGPLVREEHDRAVGREYVRLVEPVDDDQSPLVPERLVLHQRPVLDEVAAADQVEGEVELRCALGRLEQRNPLQARLLPPRPPQPAVAAHAFDGQVDQGGQNLFVGVRCDRASGWVSEWVGARAVESRERALRVCGRALRNGRAT